MTPISAITSASTSAAPDKAALKDAAKAFEAIFLRQMISTMRAAKLGDDLFGSSGSDQFRDMQDSRLADSMAEQGSIGIAEMLLKQFGGVEPDPKAVPAADVKNQ